MPLYTANRWLVSRMRAVHTLSEVERQQVHRAYRAPLDRTVVIPPGVDVPQTIPDRRGRDTVTILAVGRLNDDKGQLRLVRSIRELLRDEPRRPVRLWLAGDDAGAGRAIAEFTGWHRLGSAVRIFCRCMDEQLQELYQRAGIFALPEGH